jgi:hypothetical protein
MTIEAAQYYVDLGLLPIPVPWREKVPKLDDWPNLRLGLADLPRYFNSALANIGILLGHNGITDVDLDCSQAIVAAVALLPQTAMRFGRLSKPASHFFYLSDPPVRSRRYLDPVDKACLVELRCQKSDGSIGLQTITPPSIHPCGEEIRFEPGGNGHPAKVAATLLQTAVAKVAASSVFARHWPPERSGRNAAFIAWRALWRAAAGRLTKPSLCIARFTTSCGTHKPTWRPAALKLRPRIRSSVLVSGPQAGTLWRISLTSGWWLRRSPGSASLRRQRNRGQFPYPRTATWRI